jgi:hypothetical protein
MALSLSRFLEAIALDGKIHRHRDQGDLPQGLVEESCYAKSLTPRMGRNSNYIVLSTHSTGLSIRGRSRFMSAVIKHNPLYCRDYWKRTFR